MVMKAQSMKKRVNVLGVRKEVIKKWHLEMVSAEDNWVEAILSTSRGRVPIINTNIPPQGNRFYTTEHAARLGKIGAGAIVASDFNWVGSQSMQAAILDEAQQYDEVNEVGKRSTTKRDGETWDNWPRALRVLGPRANSSAKWTTRTC